METITQSGELSAADVDAIVDQIAAGIAPVDSAAIQTAGGDYRRDAMREYFCQLPGQYAGSWRVARVTFQRNSWGRLSLCDVDIFERVAWADVSSDSAGEILAAAVDDRRCRQ